MVGQERPVPKLYVTKRVFLIASSSGMGANAGRLLLLKPQAREQFRSRHPRKNWSKGHLRTRLSWK